MIVTIFGTSEYLRNARKIEVEFFGIDVMDIIELEEPSISEINEVISVPPLVSSRKVVWVNSTKNIELEELKEARLLVPPTTSLCLNIREKYKVKEHWEWANLGNIVECNPMEDKNIPIFIQTISLNKFELEIDHEVSKLLAFLLGSDPYKIETELAKLEPPVSTESVMEMVNRISEVNVFRVLEEIGSRNTKNAISLIEEYLFYADPIQLVNMMTYYFRQLLLIRFLLDKKTLIRNIAEVLNIKQYTVKKNAAIAKKYTLQELLKTYTHLLEINEKIKVEKKTSLIVEFVLSLREKNNQTSLPKLSRSNNN